MSESDRTAAILQPIPMRGDMLYLWTQEQFVQAAGRVPAEALATAGSGLAFMEGLQKAYYSRFPFDPSLAVEVPEVLRRLVIEHWHRARRESYA